MRTGANGMNRNYSFAKRMGGRTFRNALWDEDDVSDCSREAKTTLCQDLTHQMDNIGDIAAPHGQLRNTEKEFVSTLQ